MRYTEKRSVDFVLSWLAEQGICTGRQTYQTLIRRVLNLMPDDKAKELRVNLVLLHAIRKRLQLPLSPAPGRALPARSTPSFNSRSRRQRRVDPVKKTKSPKAPLAHPPRRERFEPGQLPLHGIVAMPTEAPAPVMTGTPDAPRGIRDWKILNDIARKKIFAKDRRMHPNHYGRVTHLGSGREYSHEDLVREFGLTATEAQSCYQDFPQ